MNVEWQAIVVIAATVPWIGIAFWSALSGTRFPKSGPRTEEKALTAATVALALAWLSVVDYGALWQGRSGATTASAASLSHATCATAAVGMSEAEVRRRLGKPDEVRSDEEIRGPGTSVLIYRDARCAVHLFNGVIDFVE